MQQRQQIGSIVAEHEGRSGSASGPDRHLQLTVDCTDIWFHCSPNVGFLAVSITDQLGRNWKVDCPGYVCMISLHSFSSAQ